MTNSNFRTMKYGMFVHYVAKATCRPDGSIPATADETADGFDAEEYLHVLKAPAGRTLHLPPTHFGKRYRTPRLLANGHAVDLMQNDAGLSVSLRDGDVWDPLDTVIELTWARELG